MEELEYNGMPLKCFCKRFKLDYDEVIKDAKRLEDTGIYLGYELERLVKIVIDQKAINQYKFKGVKLPEYCKNNGMSYQCVMGKLKEVLTDERYKECNIDELIEIALINKRVIYMYKGKPLARYCKENGVSYNTIVTRIKSLIDSEELNGDSIDEVVEAAVSECYYSRKTYFYKGKTLHKYCLENGIAYSSIVNKMNELKKSEKYKNLDTFELVKLVVESKENKTGRR